MESPIPNVTRADLSWQTRAEEALDQFLAQKRATDAFAKFMTEDVRAWAERYGLPRPPDKRAWGSIVLAAAKRGRIEKVGFGVSKNKESHSRPTAIWQLVL